MHQFLQEPRSARWLQWAAGAAPRALLSRAAPWGFSRPAPAARTDPARAQPPFSSICRRSLRQHRSAELGGTPGD